MTWKVIWSSFAEQQIAEIYDYYAEQADLVVAKKIASGIINAPNILIKNPELGARESYLADLSLEYRYILHKSFKIIYSVDRGEKRIKVADVFDTRQNPAKLKRKK